MTELAKLCVCGKPADCPLSPEHCQECWERACDAAWWAALKETPGRFICDVRVGCVAVYRRPMENCIEYVEHVAYLGMGKRIGTGWTVPWWKVAWAHVVCAWLNLADWVIEGGETA